MEMNKARMRAVRALIYLAAHPPGEPVGTRDIAGYLGESVQNVNRILREFVKRGLLDSVKGRGGGFVYNKSADSLNILEVIEIADGHPVKRCCILGLTVCAAETACPIHCQWEQIREEERSFLKKQNINQLASSISTRQI